MAQPAAAPVEVPKYPSEGGGILTKEAIRRIQKDIETLSRDPPPELVDLHVNENNMSIIHFLLRGAPDTPYAKGVYVFKFELPTNYPWAPPKISCLTPSGRFETGKHLCATFTHNHPERWTAVQSLSSLILSLMSFMAGDYTEDGMHLGYYKDAAGRYVRLSDERRAEIASGAVSACVASGFASFFPILQSLLEAKERADMTTTPAPTSLQDGATAPEEEDEEDEGEPGARGEGAGADETGPAGARGASVGVKRPRTALDPIDEEAEGPGPVPRPAAAAAASKRPRPARVVYRMQYEDSDASQVSFISSEAPEASARPGGAAAAAAAGDDEAEGPRRG